MVGILSPTMTVRAFENGYWYREQLKVLVPPLLDKWQQAIGVQADWRVKKMKTKWGACSIKAQLIWLNLELAKKPVQCLEYIIVNT